MSTSYTVQINELKPLCNVNENLVEGLLRRLTSAIAPQILVNVVGEHLSLCRSSFSVSASSPSKVFRLAVTPCVHIPNITEHIPFSSLLIFLGHTTCKWEALNEARVVIERTLKQLVCRLFLSETLSTAGRGVWHSICAKNLNWNSNHMTMLADDIECDLS